MEEIKKQRPITAKEFRCHGCNGTMRLLFIGMSGAGKTKRARSLADLLDFYHHDVDTLIAKDIGLDNVSQAGEWLGLPDASSEYRKKEEKYLALEEKYTNLEGLDCIPEGKNFVLDASGSVVYLSHATLQWLADNTLVVNIRVDDKKIDTLVKNFLRDKKPLIWQDKFSILPGERQEHALARCYTGLLAYRLPLYEKMAHVTIPFKEFYDKEGNEIIDVICRHLEST
jgi:shikimate kinase